MLLGNGIQSSWRSVIADGSAQAGTHEFVFRKSFTGTYTFTNTAGEKTIKDFIFLVHGQDNRFDMELKTEATRLLDIQYANVNVTPTGSSQDSLFVFFESGSHYYIARRL